MVASQLPAHVAASGVRYIKLGQNGRWAKRSTESGEIHFGYGGIPHDLCSAGAWSDVAKLLATMKKGIGAVTSGVREVREFYELDSTVLWITTFGRHLWWAFAEPHVEWIGETKNAGARLRRTLSGWSNKDIHGQPLILDQLSSKLTQVAGYRGTICEVSCNDYLLRRINGITEPIVKEAEAVRAQLVSVTRKLIAGLHWSDFETLTDLIFARSGWQRLTMVGRDADIDILFQQPSTKETAFVQVKSAAGQTELDDYYERFQSSGADRFFFICHSFKGAPKLPVDKTSHLWTGDELASVVVRHGLFDWALQHNR